MVHRETFRVVMNVVLGKRCNDDIVRNSGVLKDSDNNSIALVSSSEDKNCIQDETIDVDDPASTAVLHNDRKSLLALDKSCAAKTAPQTDVVSNRVASNDNSESKSVVTKVDNESDDTVLTRIVVVNGYNDNNNLPVANSDNEIIDSNAEADNVSKGRAVGDDSSAIGSCVNNKKMRINGKYESNNDVKNSHRTNNGHLESCIDASSENEGNDRSERSNETSVHNDKLLNCTEHSISATVDGVNGSGDNLKSVEQLPSSVDNSVNDNGLSIPSQHQSDENDDENRKADDRLNSENENYATTDKNDDDKVNSNMSRNGDKFDLRGSSSRNVDNNSDNLSNIDCNIINDEKENGGGNVPPDELELANGSRKSDKTMNCDNEAVGKNDLNDKSRANKKRKKLSSSDDIDLSKNKQLKVDENKSSKNDKVSVSLLESKVPSLKVAEKKSESLAPSTGSADNEKKKSKIDPDHRTEESDVIDVNADDSIKEKADKIAIASSSNAQPIDNNNSSHCSEKAAVENKHDSSADLSEAKDFKLDKKPVKKEHVHTEKRNIAVKRTCAYNKKRISSSIDTVIDVVDIDDLSERNVSLPLSSTSKCKIDKEGISAQMAVLQSEIRLITEKISHIADKEKSKLTVPGSSSKSSHRAISEHFEEIFRQAINKCSLTRYHLEELLIQKLCEAMADRSEIGKLRNEIKQLKISHITMKENHNYLENQVRHLKIVCGKYIDHTNAHNVQYQSPIKFYRTVGVQVSLNEHSRNFKTIIRASKECVTSNETISSNDLSNEQPAKKTAFTLQSRSKPLSSTSSAESSTHDAAVNESARSSTSSLQAKSKSSQTTTSSAELIPEVITIDNDESVSTSKLHSTPLISKHNKNKQSNSATATSAASENNRNLNASKTITTTSQVSKNSLKRTPNKNTTTQLTNSSTSTTNDPLKSTPLDIIDLTEGGISKTTSSSKSNLGNSAAINNSRPSRTFVPSNNVSRSTTSVAVGSSAKNQTNSVLRNNNDTSLTSAAPSNQTTFNVALSNTEQTMPSGNFNSGQQNNSFSTALESQHPAPLPDDLTTYHNPPFDKLVPPRPSLGLARSPAGIVLSWDMELKSEHANIKSYQLYLYRETKGAIPNSNLWTKIGDVEPLPLPMACTLSHFEQGSRYHFAVRAVDIYSRNGLFSSPGSILLVRNR